MSGFAPEWLTLREGADHRARNAELLAALGKHFSTRDAITVVDLGAGLGSNLRAAAPVLPARQHWVLVDHDPVLLAGACDAIASSSNLVRPATAGLEVMKAGRSIRVEVRHAIVAKNPGAFATYAPDLVTAAALFDLVSEDWIGRFTAALTAARVPLYAVLDYTVPMPGARRIRPTPPWSPRSTATRAVTRVSALRRDRRQRTSWPSVSRRWTTASSAARSRRILSSGETKLIRVLTQDFAEAVRETGEIPAATIEAWQKARMADGVTCSISHEDILAIAR